MAIFAEPEIFIGGSATQRGTLIDVVDGYDISLDCFHPGTRFTFSMWRSSVRQSTWDILRNAAKCGAFVTFRLNHVLVITGYIETLREGADGHKGAYVVVSGRDIIGKTHDWDANPALNFRGMMLDDALEALFGDFGISVIVGVDAQQARRIQAGSLRTVSGGVLRRGRVRRQRRLDRSKPRPGEKVWPLAETMVRRAGLWMWGVPVEDRATMAVVLDQFDYKTDSGLVFVRRNTSVGIDMAGNINSGDHFVQTRSVPTFVRVFGHCARGDKFSFRYAPGVANDYLTLDDVTAGRVVVPHPYQPRYVKSKRARTYEEANQEADRLIARSMMDFRVYKATVQGHETPVNGRSVFYHFNTTAMLQDDVLGLRERMFIHGVHFKGRRDSGSTTTLSMIPLRAVQLTVGSEVEV